MKLVEYGIGQKLKVKKITASSDLKQRLISFGIIKGAEVEILGIAPAKSTMEIRVGKMRIALRKKEAESIEVEEI